MEVGLSEEAKADAEDILEKAEADYQQLTVSKEVYTALAGLQAFPTTYFVDSQGNILQKIEGSNNYDGWKQAIEECLEKMEAQ